MSEFSGWVDMAIRFCLAVAVFVAVVVAAFVASYRFFGWIGPIGIVAVWVIACAAFEFFDRRKR